MQTAMVNGTLGLNGLTLLQPGTEALCWCRAAVPASAQAVTAGSHRAAQAVWLYYWRRAARIAPAHWASLLLAYLTVLRGRDQIPVPEAVGALLHYEEESCPCEFGIPRPCLGACRDPSA